MVFVHHFLSAQNEWAPVYNFFAATVVVNVFDNPVPYENVYVFSYQYHGP